MYLQYAKLRTQAAAMKERYEQRFTELEEERDLAIEERDSLADKGRQLHAQLSQQRVPADGDPDQLASEVKKIMNKVFHMLRAKFSQDQSYSGGDVQAAILETIKVSQ